MVPEASDELKDNRTQVRIWWITECSRLLLMTTDKRYVANAFSMFAGDTVLNAEYDEFRDD